jgi:NTP pyrophosphatase (non-canonical NTP hydrolase)
MEPHFNKLTPAQAERLAVLIEECGEVIQAAGKILRHGYDSRSPLTTGTNNRIDLERECGQVRYAIFALCDAHDLNERRLFDAEICKVTAIKPYLHHQGPNAQGQRSAVGASAGPQSSTLNEKGPT